MNTWLIRLEGGSESAIDSPTLAQMALDRQITPDTTVRHEGLAAKYRAREIPGLFSPKNAVTALVLTVFLGDLGADRFYTGRVGLGFLKLITAGMGGLWWIIDIGIFATRSARDGTGRRVV